ncbi:hypothetical protein [Cellulomonas sp.]|uniref:hypothetical protein n=1 Tax=Cellulomonas sp. TaxID=40001 RepID=UPI001B28FEF3|nr:hypothetical protein [Cellulomonas sp.]MBO9555827.1 hypothetical protein [Cellulomonas sp.]
MMIDCDGCSARGAACTDCVVTFLTVTVRPGAAPAPRPLAGVVELDRAEQHALGVLAAQGLVPPLRLEPAG